MLTTTKTIYGGMLQTCNFLGKQYIPANNTTLNEIWNIHDQAAVAVNDRFVAEYFSIGHGGHRYITGAEGIPYLKSLPHKGTDGSLYRPLPFLLRPINDDIGPTERARYGMRVPVEIEGVWYWAYYLRRLDLSTTTPQMKITTITDGVASDVAFVPDNSTLTPAQPEMSNTGVISTDGRYITVSAIVSVIMNAEEIAELINAVEIMFGVPELSMISEIGIVSAIRKAVPLLDENLAEQSGLTYYEALRATLVNYVGADFNANLNRDQFSMTLDMGTSDPTFGNSDSVVIPGP